MADNFPNLMKTVNPQIQKAQQTPSRNMKKNIPKHYQNQIA